MGWVFYVAYGSNLDADRFGCYLVGGRPDGATRSNAGSRDGTSWVAAFPARTRRPVCFAGWSRTWGGGGMAFLDPQASDDVVTPVRVYLITHSQFEDLVAQENGLGPGSVAIDPQSLSDPGQVRGDWGRYDLVVSWGSPDGHRAMATVTSTRRTDHAPPTAHYLRVLARGLRQSHAMSDDEIERYLAARPGIVDPDAVRAVL
ncbi:MAG TPA: histone deacetylase [Actinomycetota bacterium]|nr:histone deacetylase [Actinomycetota bacterium]